MKWFSWRKKTEVDADLQISETKLQHALLPVTPRVDFVQGLRRNLLQQFPEVELPPSKQNQNLQTGLLIAGGILGSVFMVVAGVRGLVSLVGVLGLLINWLRQDGQQSPSTSKLAH